MNKRWFLQQTDPQSVQDLYESLRINRTLCTLLVQRGILTYEEAKKFFRPSLDEHLYDPFLMQDMDRAVERIDRAIRNKEKILVYGDYDVDGTTAVALVYSFLKDLYYDVDYYLPDRYREGYGVSFESIDWAHQNGFTLIIALDCGIKAIDQIDRALELGIDFIVCDHHRPDKQLPNAHAVLDPKRPDCTYPFEELSGCGIGFKLIQAIASLHAIPFKRIVRYLDLVVVSIAADIVSITDENRLLAHHGLKILNKSPRPGLRSLIELNTPNRQMTISDIVFTIAPRLNAAGRIDDAKHAVRLLITQEGNIAKQNADVLQEQNTKRKLIDSDITEEAFKLIEDDPNYNERKSTVMYQSHWHKGVIGIIASRLAEKYYRPTIVMTLSNGIVAGSARSIPGFDIYNAIESCSDLLTQYGGHKYAAGLTLLEENVTEFISRFEAEVARTLSDDMLIPEISIDAELHARDINQTFYNILKQFAPFGPGNMRPVFMMRHLSDTGWSSAVGNNHLRLSARQENSSIILKGIGYNMGDKLPYIKSGGLFDIAFTLEENTYNHQTTLQLNLKDIKESTSQPFDGEVHYIDDLSFG
ncbi:MAG: single-stranded-DNA-specific exonuclease RecJ [Chitinophagales bacterium]|nr:single-stranded-DNA-specific exonuclease RecJ [Chitinophagales bacterium]